MKYTACDRTPRRHAAVHCGTTPVDESFPMTDVYGIPETLEL
jgi:hypothetical protein